MALFALCTFIQFERGTVLRPPAVRLKLKPNAFEQHVKIQCAEKVLGNDQYIYIMLRVNKLNMLKLAKMMLDITLKPSVTIRLTPPD